MRIFEKNRDEGDDWVTLYIGPGQITVPTEPWPEKETITLAEGEVAERYIRNEPAARYDAVGIDTTQVYSSLEAAGYSPVDLQNKFREDKSNS